MKIAYNPIGGAVLTVSPPENDITFDLPGLAIWAKGVRFGKYETFLKHTSISGGGRDGLVPAPNYTATAVRFLREDGTWVTPTNTDTKNTTGSTNSASKLYLIGATEQSANPQTYSNSSVYATNGALTADTIITTGLKSPNHNNVLYNMIKPHKNALTYNSFSSNAFKDETGIAVNGNANGILWVGTHNPEASNTSTIGYGHMLGFIGGNEALYHKTVVNGDTTKAWKQIAYTSSNITGNAASADKLKTKRKLWGLDFDGTADVSGSLTGVTSINMDGDIVINDGTNNDRYIKFQYNNTDTYAWRLGYTGSQHGENNDFVIQTTGANGSNTTFNNVLQLKPSTKDAIFSASVTATNFIGNLDGTYVNALTGYTKANAVSSIGASDSLNTALGKLEYKADSAYELVKGAYDGDGTIENLAEILKVLEGIKDTETIQSIIGKYLPLTGGTMSGDVVWTNGTGHSTTLPGHIYRNFHSKTEATETIKAKGEVYDHYYPTGPQAISYANLRVWDADNNSYKTLRFGGDGTFTWNSKIILHSGNSYINNNTITINGTSLSPLVASGTSAQIIKGNGSYEEDSLYFKYRNEISPNVNADDLDLNGLYLNATGNNKDETKPNVNFPDPYGYLINFYGNSGGWSGCQLHANKINYLYRAKFDGSWSDWRILIDSNNYSNYLPFLNSTSTHATKTSKIYAPTSGGTAGLILKSNGNAAPSWVNSTTLTAGSITHTSIGTNDTNKYYLLGSSSQNSSVTINSHSNVYIQGGELHANNVWGIHSRTSNLQLDTTWNHSKIAFGPIASTTANYNVEVLDGEGSYVVQLSNGTGIWTGYFSIRHTSNPGSTTTIADEIVLQGGDSNTYERPYLRTLNMGNNIISLQIAYSTTLNDSSDWIFSFKRLI